MYHPVRKKGITMTFSTIVNILLLTTLYISQAQGKSIDTAVLENSNSPIQQSFDNNLIDFDENYSIKFNKKFDKPWHGNTLNKESYRYTIIKENENYKNGDSKANKSIFNDNPIRNNENVQNIMEESTTQDYSVIPLELLSTTENKLIRILESTTEPDLTVVPLTTTATALTVVINSTVSLPSSTTTESYETTTFDTTTEQEEYNNDLQLTVIPLVHIKNATNVNMTKVKVNFVSTTDLIVTENVESLMTTTDNVEGAITMEATSDMEITYTTEDPNNLKLESEEGEDNKTSQNLNNSTVVMVNDMKYNKLNSTENKNISRADTTSTESEEGLPIYTELDAEEEKEFPEDYYDSKDIVPTTAPKTDALSVFFGLAGTVVESVVESVAERVVPKTIFDLFKRMQKQNEALEAERLRSREENGGLGQFTRGIIKTISSGISKPLSQLVAGAKDIGSLDTDRGFVASIASGVTSVANVAYSVADAFKDRVQAIYPGTVWCGDGRSATARSSDLGLFFFTDTCCRQHDACKLYIRSGETRYGLTNTGLFTRSHCSCDDKFRECLHRTNSLVSSQIGLTYFNVLGPQCFRRAHPIVKCVRRTRITGLKCEEYELDYTKPRMWQWFDNETF